MALYAVDDLDDTLDVTKRFLLPFDLSRWAKLALVVFFVGVPGANVFQFNVGGSGTPNVSNGGPTVPGPDFVVSDRMLLVAGALVVAAIGIGLLFLLVGSVMEFVLVESLRAEAVTIRRYWSSRWGQGIRLFGFRLVLGLLVLVPIGLFIVFAILPVFLSGAPVASIAFLFVLFPLFFLLVLFVGVVNSVTTAFVVPIMVLEDIGVLAGWRRLWPTIRSQWKQYGAYVVLAFVLTIAAGILIGFTMAGIGVALLIPFGLLGALGYVLFTVSSTVGIAVIALVVLAFFLALLVGFAFVSVPVVVYLRYYALLVLGDTNGEFDLVPGQRAAVRESEPQ